ncbi:hypothetical protein J8273_8862 [Carpediemonas membranifera]|uniref:Uncharacterized protein n=1 Tax=Carpediemonas membranifera TaxID=201153 RepID=A0A8J6AXA2_9EUKA|nr:hypothetical protein J8273_8862 [Carpediemonas membranifera]|eukprot:KAG9389569.1 hypothetical protein J8273_8862 [Carpediemonas membranifera]
MQGNVESAKGRMQLIENIIRHKAGNWEAICSGLTTKAQRYLTSQEAKIIYKSTARTLASQIRPHCGQFVPDHHNRAHCFIILREFRHTLVEFKRSGLKKYTVNLAFSTAPEGQEMLQRIADRVSDVLKQLNIANRDKAAMESRTMRPIEPATPIRAIDTGAVMGRGLMTPLTPGTATPSTRPSSPAECDFRVRLEPRRGAESKAAQFVRNCRATVEPRFAIPASMLSTNVCQLVSHLRSRWTRECKAGDAAANSSVLATLPLQIFPTVGSASLAEEDGLTIADALESDRISVAYNSTNTRAVITLFYELPHVPALEPSAVPAPVDLASILLDDSVADFNSSQEAELPFEPLSLSFDF